MQTFFDDADYAAYIEIMSQSCRRFGVTIWAYCLMPNHIHLICVPDKDDSLRKAIGFAHEKYTRQINFKKSWQGYLWQGRFFSTPMDEYHLAMCTRYIEMNPVVAHLCEKPGQYKWSSAIAHYTGHNDRLVDVAPMLARFPDWDDFLLRNVNDPKDIETLELHSRTGRPLGSEEFVNNLEARTGLRLHKMKPGPKSGDRVQSCVP